jgi:hypothetical protein
MCKRDRIIVLMDDKRNVVTRFNAVRRPIVVAAA